jgi:hypothetical protein
MANELKLPVGIAKLGLSTELEARPPADLDRLVRVQQWRRASEGRRRGRRRNRAADRG